ncbi:hypothetical protein [Actinomadura hibisca]|uniref:hypothetical protein n=1 Tax=Actinomadura hibisca TaxID=68565 RepID=UPI00083229ED|nr:hypothetical protein [Actinomadura hibisca]
MSFDARKRAPACPIDTPQTNAASGSDEEVLLVELAEALRGLGEKANVRRVIGGPPVLDVSGAVSRLNERIETGRRPDGTVVARFSWGEDLPADVDQAAVMVRRVINPAV